MTPADIPRRIDPSLSPCNMCQEILYWRKAIGHEIVCATCHPPPEWFLVKEWIEALPAPTVPFLHVNANDALSLANQRTQPIEIDGHPQFIGRWLAQHFERLSNNRYSIGKTPEDRFFVICKSDSDQSIKLEWFESRQSICKSNLPEALKRAVPELAQLLPPSSHQNQHTIDPKTGIWPMSEWGPKCGRAFDEIDREHENSTKNRVPFRAVTSESILVWNGKYVDYGDGPEEEYITWNQYIRSIQPPPSTVPAEAIRLSATCGDTPIEIRKVDEEHWHLFVLTRPANKYTRRKDFNTIFREHAQRTAEAWYGPAKEGWHVEQTEESK